MSLLVELPPESYAAANLTGFTAAAGYDAATAGAMAWMSQLAYEIRHPGKVPEILGKWGLELAAPIGNPVSGVLPLIATRGFVAIGWGATVIAFTGTDPLVPANWLTDFDILPAPDDIHEGFEDAFKVVLPQIRAAVLAPDAARRRLIITGHSLGGALAAVAALHLHDLVNIDSVYTFGMPRCGGPTFAAEYEAKLGARTFRFVHGDDIVPTVPPSNFGFRHVGRILTCVQGGSFHGMRPADGPGDEPAFQDSALQAIRDVFRAIAAGSLPLSAQPGPLGIAYSFLPPSIGDHLPARYLRAFGFTP